ncbi:MAG: secretin N-terminal domain-containing protein [Elusimicrobiaceae bacterium]|nr:secretin N-terminal domain-containing protein [Elusimicrobiaceae bacterium]
MNKIQKLKLAALAATLALSAPPAGAASVIQQITAKGDSLTALIAPPYEYETKLYKNPPRLVITVQNGLFPPGNKIYSTSGRYVKQVKVNNDTENADNILIALDLRALPNTKDVHVRRTDEGLYVGIGDAAAEPEPAVSTEPAVAASLTPAATMRAADPGPASNFIISPTETTLSSRKVTLKLRNTPLISILEAITRQTGASFIVDEKLQERKFAALMEDVSLRDALRALLEVHGMGYEQIGNSNTFVVKEASNSRARLATRIFKLKYTQLAAMASSGGGAGTLGAKSGSSGSSGSKSGSSSLSAPGAGSAPSSTASSGDGSVSFLNVIRSALTDDGRIQTYPETNSLIISDSPENFPNIEELIEKLDTPVPQVMIEAYFIETTATNSKNLGITWGTDGVLAQFQGNSQLVSFPLTNNGEINPMHAYDWSTFSGGGTVESDSYYGGYSFGILSFTQLVAVLKAVMIEGHGQYLSKPKVMTLNNKPAVISVTADTVVEFETKQFTGSGYLGEQSKNAVRQETGITMTVTPQVNEGGMITLSITPQISRPQYSEFFPSDDVVDTQKRSITTSIRVSDGSTVLIGGLLSNEESSTVQKVPILSSIPIIGKLLFTNTSSSKVKKELLIFITPRIVKS